MIKWVRAMEVYNIRTQRLCSCVVQIICQSQESISHPSRHAVRRGIHYIHIFIFFFNGGMVKAAKAHLFGNDTAIIGEQDGLTQIRLSKGPPAPPVSRRRAEHIAHVLCLYRAT